MRGRHLGGAVDHDWLALRRLLAAVVARAVLDAVRGDPEAREFMDVSGTELAGVLGLRRNAFAGWRNFVIAGNHRVVRAARGESSAERSRQYRARLRAAKEAALDQEGEAGKR